MPRPGRSTAKYGRVIPAATSVPSERSWHGRKSDPEHGGGQPGRLHSTYSSGEVMDFGTAVAARNDASAVPSYKACEKDVASN